MEESEKTMREFQGKVAQLEGTMSKAQSDSQTNEAYIQILESQITALTKQNELQINQLEECKNQIQQMVKTNKTKRVSNRQPSSLSSSSSSLIMPETEPLNNERLLLAAQTSIETRQEVLENEETKNLLKQRDQFAAAFVSLTHEHNLLKNQLLNQNFEAKVQKY